MTKRIVILGSTGSIGRSTLDVVDHHPDRFLVAGLVAGRCSQRLVDQIRRYHPQAVAVADPQAAQDLRKVLGSHPVEIRWGVEGAAEVTVGVGAQLAVAAIVGAAGLLPTFAAASAGMTVALANKEALVAAGELMIRAVRSNGALLLPVDSEHNAIHQCLRAGHHGEVRRLWLTASGGPFRGRSRAELEQVSREQALCHPTWKMGPKITIDSASLMNKGLEVIEAHWLFGLPGSALEVLVHPQSTIHSMVEFRDGSIVAQLGSPDMRHPIQYSLTWPERWEGNSNRLDPFELTTLTFERPDRHAFPCLDLAYRALDAGGDAPARLNAANEIAVAAFLDGQIGFLDIPRIIAEVLESAPARPIEELSDVLEADRRARETARNLLTRS